MQLTLPTCPNKSKAIIQNRLRVDFTHSFVINRTLPLLTPKDAMRLSFLRPKLELKYSHSSPLKASSLPPLTPPTQPQKPDPKHPPTHLPASCPPPQQQSPHPSNSSLPHHLPSSSSSAPAPLYPQNPATPAQPSSYPSIPSPGSQLPTPQPLSLPPPSAAVIALTMLYFVVAECWDVRLRSPWER